MWREKIGEIVKEYQDLTQKIANPQSMKDMATYRSLTQALAEIEPVVGKYEEYEKKERELEENRAVSYTHLDVYKRQL